jgi:hypothetical protein
MRSFRLLLAFILVFCWLIPALPGSPVADEPQQAQAKDQKDEGDENAAIANPAEFEKKACGDTEVNFKVETDKKQHPTPPAPSDKAMVYVIRPTMMGNKIQTKLAVDGKWIGVNRGKNYFFFTLDPGEHYCCSQAENRSLLLLKVEAGKTYYLQQKIKMGFMKARNKLVLLDEAEGQEGLAKCHLAVFTEKAK